MRYLFSLLSCEVTANLSNIQAHNHKFKVTLITCSCIALDQWFLTWVRSSPRGSASQLQGFGSLIHYNCITRVKFIFCWFCSLKTVILYANDAWCRLCTYIVCRYTHIVEPR